MIGQTASGALIATIGAGGAMLLNAATYWVPIASATRIRVGNSGRNVERSPLGVALSQGITTLWKRSALLGTISLMATAGGLPLAISLMMPAFARQVLDTDSIGLGLLRASSAVGSVFSTLPLTISLGSLLAFLYVLWDPHLPALSTPPPLKRVRSSP